MSSSTSRCDRIIALIDACLAEVDSAPATPRHRQPTGKGTPS